MFCQVNKLIVKLIAIILAGAFLPALVLVLPKAVQAAPSGSVLNFDGGDYLTVADAAVLDQASALSWSVWVKPASTPGSDAYIFYRDTAYYLKQTSSDTMVGAVYYGSVWHTAATSALTTGQWTHIELTYDATAGYLKIYKNGVEADSQSHSTAITAVATAMYIGALNTTPDNPFTGKIDDLRLYQYARTPAQVKQDYNQGMAFYAGPQTTCAEDPGSCITKGLVGYWSFEEGSGQTTADLSGNSNTGTLGTGATPDSADPRWSTAEGLPRQSLGGGGGALSFDGSNDYVLPATDIAMGSSNFTLSVWVFVKNVTTFSQGIVGRGNLNIAISYLITISNESGGVFKTYLSGNGGGDGSYPISASIPSINTWYHVILVKNGTFGGLYINGVLQSSRNDIPATLYAGSARFNIGCQRHSTTNNYYLDGLISDVRIYNRALSPEEIRYLYNRGGPVGHWSFDEGSGALAQDKTSNDYDATLHNITTSTDWVSGKFGGALDFNGTDSWEDVGTCYNVIKTVSFWTKPDTTTECFVDLNGSAYVSATAGVVSATGFTSPAIYVNGRQQQTGEVSLTANQWHHIEITTETGLNASDFDIGRIEGVGYMQGLIDDVRLYQYVRTPAQVLQDYNAGKSIRFK